MKIDLSVGERLMLLHALPREGSLVTVKLSRELRESLSFSQEEHDALKLEPTEMGYAWDENAPQVKEFDLGEKQLDLVRDALRELDAKRQVTDQHIGLFDKFGVGN